MKKILLKFTAVIMFGSSPEMKQYTKHEKPLAFSIPQQATDCEKMMTFLPRHPIYLSLKQEMFWVSQAFEKTVKKRGSSQGICGTILATKDDLISQNVNCDLYCRSLSAQPISRQLRALKVWNRQFDTILHYSLAKTRSRRTRVSDLCHALPMNPIEINKNVRVREVYSLTYKVLVSAIPFAYLGHGGN